MRGPCAATLLGRALVASAASAGATVTIETLHSKRWESATFSGARHAVGICGRSSDGFDRWLDGIADCDLPVAGHLVADITVAEMLRQDGRVDARIEALTVADA